MTYTHALPPASHQPPYTITTDPPPRPRPRRPRTLPRDGTRTVDWDAVCPHGRLVTWTGDTNATTGRSTATPTCTLCP